jgi:bisphosphoglycerate-independent phosphoglycerate mutase (AlkP superfamily)
MARKARNQASAHRRSVRRRRRRHRRASALTVLDPSSETEKYAHVTFFFNGGVEKQFEHEERHLIDSPKVATYDLQPKMSVKGVADKVAAVVRAAKHEFVMCNFAPPDMVRPSPSPLKCITEQPCV